MRFFYYLYSSIKGNNPFLVKIRFYSILRFGVRFSANLIFPLYYFITSGCLKYRLLNKDSSGKRIIVSLTSFPLRINRLWLVIESLLRQTYKPDMIVLWLSKEQFPNPKKLPNRLLKLQKRGLVIRFVDGDIRSHKKYYYALQEFPNDILVTADDDIFYSSDWLYSLYHAHTLNPESIICYYGYQIMYDSNGQIKKYNEWKIANIYDSDIFFGSGGGTLFPVGALYKDVLNISLACHLCPIADDVWLNSMVRLNRRNVIKIANGNIILPVLNRNNVTLTMRNVDEDMNDKQIQNVISYYEKCLNFNPFKRKVEYGDI